MRMEAASVPCPTVSSQDRTAVSDAGFRRDQAGQTTTGADQLPPAHEKRCTQPAFEQLVIE